MSTLLELNKLKGLDFTVQENKDLFKNLFKKLRGTRANDIDADKRLLMYMIRSVGLESKDFYELKNYAFGVKQTDTDKKRNFKEFHTSIYELSILSDWDETNPLSIIEVALNANIYVPYILTFAIDNKLFDDYVPMLDMLLKHDAISELDQIDWVAFDQLGVKHPYLTQKAWEYYKNIGSVKIPDYTDFDLKHKAMIKHLTEDEFKYIKPEFSKIISGNKFVSTNAAKSLRFKMLYNIWLKHLELHGLTRDANINDSDLSLDQKILTISINEKVSSLISSYPYINLEQLNGVLKDETIKNGYACLNQMYKLGKINNYIDKPWALPFIKEHLDIDKLDNAKKVELLTTNSFGPTLAYAPDKIKEVFMHCVHENINMVFYNIHRFLPKASSIDDIQDTPITKEALAVALLCLEHESKNRYKTLNLLVKVLPGIDNEESRELLINKFLPNAKQILKLNSLYSDVEVVDYVSKGIVDLNINIENVKGLEF